MIATGIMLGITLLVFRYFINIWTYGDENKFYVVGKWTPGLIGLCLSVILGTISACMRLSVLWPVVLFFVSAIWLFFSQTPIVKVDGEYAEYILPKKKLIFHRKDAVLMDGQLYVGGRCLYLGRGSVNYDRLTAWVENKHC